MMGRVVQILDIPSTDPYLAGRPREWPVIEVETSEGIERIEWRRTGHPPDPGELVDVVLSDDARADRYAEHPA